METNVEKELEKLNNKIEELEKEKKDNGRFLSDKSIETITKSAGKGVKWSLIIGAIMMFVMLIIVIVVTVVMVNKIPVPNIPVPNIPVPNIPVQNIQ